MTSEDVNYVQLLEGLPMGAWVAISERVGSVVAYGQELEKVLSQSAQQGEPAPLIVRVSDPAVQLVL